MRTAVERLRDAGLRVTAPRVAVLSSIGPGEHLTADDVGARARAALGAVSTQAVYDVLHALAAAGLLRRVEPAGSAVRYELRVGDNHHHAVCRCCGTVTDVECATGAAPCLYPAPGAEGYLLDEAEVVWWGVCPACQKPADPSAAADPARLPTEN